MTKTKVRVGSVSYLNAKPLIYGFEHGAMKDKLELVIDYPSAIARQLVENKIDIGLVPVAIIPQLKEYHIVSDYCIGSIGEVASVCLFSDVPLDEVKEILLDYQSRTSVALLKILLNEYWKISPALIDAPPGYEATIGLTTAGLVIGDRALQQRLKAAYIYDLGAAWTNMTGLPFVFAAWISNKQLPQDFITAFNDSNRQSLGNLDQVLLEINYPAFNIKKYYTDYISYQLDDAKRAGLSFFLSKIAQQL